MLSVLGRLFGTGQRLPSSTCMLQLIVLPPFFFLAPFGRHFLTKTYKQYILFIGRNYKLRTYTYWYTDPEEIYVHKYIKTVGLIRTFSFFWFNYDWNMVKVSLWQSGAIVIIGHTHEHWLLILYQQNHYSLVHSGDQK